MKVQMQQGVTDGLVKVAVVIEFTGVHKLPLGKTKRVRGLASLSSACAPHKPSPFIANPRTSTL
ncbi:hypothetical protein THF1D04_330027 [Vibrio owensii]|uniref:Uncharacterized protein n=1 Tax=Vibrio owensii TaxID=696485 RepID=A0AAU9Q8S6_9VIBR|nr:hypothetical protein THF1D04_330027 [Vibrio owensii]